jgi:LITAF-like zinc ribbon protein
MPFCTSCGADNGSGRFCVKCGTPLPLAAESWRASSELNQGAAKVDDRPPAYVPPVFNPYQPPAPMARSPHNQFGAVGFKCPYCQTQSPPVLERKITTGGWILFAVLLLLCFPLCWMGLLIKEDQRVCSFCRLALG